MRPRMSRRWSRRGGGPAHREDPSPGRRRRRRLVPVPAAVVGLANMIAPSLRRASPPPPSAKVSSKPPRSNRARRRRSGGAARPMRRSVAASTTSIGAIGFELGIGSTHRPMLLVAEVLREEPTIDASFLDIAGGACAAGRTQISGSGPYEGSNREAGDRRRPRTEQIDGAKRHADREAVELVVAAATRRTSSGKNGASSVATLPPKAGRPKSRPRRRRLAAGGARRAVGPCASCAVVQLTRDRRSSVSSTGVSGSQPVRETWNQVTATGHRWLSLFPRERFVR